MSAYLTAALGYAVWWITAIGQEDIQKKLKPLQGVLEELAVVDVMCFGLPLEQIMSWDRFNSANFLTTEPIDE